jgi:hypothetical protein
MSVVTIILIVVILFFSRHELVHAWDLLEQVNLWILLLMVPAQLLTYYAGGEMVFSYLRAKKSIGPLKPQTLVRMALELNFVNHVLPSGGVSGISYLNWRLGLYGVPASRSTLAQVVRHAMGFVAFMLLLAISVLAVTIDGSINRWIILVSAVLVGSMTAILLSLVFLISSQRRMEVFGGWLVRNVNHIVRRVTLGRKRKLLKSNVVDTFFGEMHHDYLALMYDKRVLIKPLLWGIVYTLSDVSLFVIAFWALGSPINPAPILIAYGVASVAGFFVATPGGAGAYEAIMISFLALAGITQGIALAGILLTRVILLVGTIVLGYIFYQHAILKYGNGKQRPSVG